MKTSQCLMLVMITIATTFTTLSIRTEAATTAPAPSPSDDCSTTIYTLTPCLPFVEEGNNNTAAKPSNDCCSALADIVKSDVRCLCVALKMASGIGIPVNMTKALSLPQACDIKTPPVSDCDHGAPTPAPAPAPYHPPSPSPSPSPSPTPSPSSSPSPTPAPTPSPVTPIVEAPAQAPTTSGAPAMKSSNTVSLLVGLLVAAWAFLF